MSTGITPTLLLVDDEEENIWVIEDFLKDLHCKIYKAYDGQQALKLAPVINPDLILLDINMPEIDGIQVCRALKKEPKFQNIPVIFVTAWGDMATHVEAIDAGGYSFVTKPVVREQLLAYVSQALQIKQTGDRAVNTLADTRSAVGMLVHDLRNLIQVNHGYLQLALGSGELSDELTEFVQTAKQAAVEMQVLVNAILDIEKRESVGLQASPSRISLGELVQQRASYASVTGQGRKLKVTLPGSHDPAEAVTDPVILARVLDNLLLNALKFAPENSLIEVELVADEKGGWRISIINDGKVIPREYHDKIFEKFMQLELRQKTGLRGVGLGLAFCKMAMETLQGGISIESPVAGKDSGVAMHLHVPANLKTDA
jgi:two-component system, sensor histidine kinase and response regulator